MPTFECPTCLKTFTVEKNEDAPSRPFCTERCKMVDLGRWLDGTYKITKPAEPDDLSKRNPETED